MSHERIHLMPHVRPNGTNGALSSAAWPFSLLCTNRSSPSNKVHLLQVYRTISECRTKKTHHEICYPEYEKGNYPNGQKITRGSPNSEDRGSVGLFGSSIGSGNGKRCDHETEGNGKKRDTSWCLSIQSIRKWYSSRVIFIPQFSCASAWKIKHGMHTNTWQHRGR